MRLKAIEMQGFKSFPDKTRITFDSGVTAIIGPNGSGKSNISDAIRWVLGEMSAKSLRGSRMEDVIFNGTAARAASGCASVSLIINTEEEYNRHNHMTIENTEPEETEEGEEAETSDTSKAAGFHLWDEPEMSVTRKLYRSGESEYYINKKQVRLKDIYELFYDTGIGREGYSVIGQGKISEVLSQKDDERRSIFEEAAGISKIRYKKLEAERKLRDTEANLVRINDILSEVSSRIGPLAKEAENAKQYLVLSEEKKGIEITLWLERIDYLRSRRVEVETELASAKLALTQAEEEVRKCDETTDRLLNENYEFSRIMSECEHEKTEAVHSRGEAEARKAVCTNDISHASETLLSAKAAVESARKDKAEAEAQTTLCKLAKSEAEAKLASIGDECQKAEEEYEAARQRCAEADSKSETAAAKRALLVFDQSSVSARKAAATASLEAEKKNIAENGERIRLGEERIKALEAELTGVSEKRDNAVKDIISTEKSISDTENSRADAISDLRELDKKITEAKVALSAEEQKLEQLTRFEQLLEGYSDSVKRVVGDCRNGKIKNGSSDVKLYGTVSNIISSADKYTVAIETSLAAAVQFIVVDKESDAKACIRYLKENKLGRATFLPLESVEGKLADVSAVKNMDGYVGIASELVSYEKRFEGVVNDLLGRTIIAENIDFASAIARKTGFRVKTVTLDGQVINAGGSYTGGSSASKVGVFTRARDIEKLKESVKERKNAVAALEKESEDKNNSVASFEKKLSDLRVVLSGANASRSDLTSLADSLGARIEEERSHIEAISSGSALLDNINSELAAIEEDIKKLDTAVALAEAETEKCRTEAASAKEAEEEIFDKVNEARMQLYAAKNELAVAGERLSVCETREEEISARIALAEDSARKADETASSRTSEIGKLNAELAEYDSVIAGCEKRLADLLAGREEKEKELNEMRRKQKEVSAVKEEAFRRVTEDEMKCNSVNTEYDTVSGKLWDEYELTYSDAERFRLPKEKMDKAPSRLNSLKAKIRSMGVINVNAVEEYAALKERYDTLTTQTDDLNKARASLDRTITKLASGMKETFLECFDKINVEFNSVFCELFGGGSAKCELTDPMMPLECGIDIILKVPGKSVRSISLLSGGEQSFAAISLYLALQKVNPAPFCVFDEIESALDEVNVVKLASYVRRGSDKTQYILITHRRGTMERADTIYGITMHQKGISDHMKLNMAKLDENIKEYTDQ